MTPPKPSDLKPTELDRRIQETHHTMMMFLDRGYSEDTALELTDITLNRNDRHTLLDSIDL
jgi:hypothetical protein